MNTVGPLISIDPERMSGAPCFAGTRVPIQNLFDYVEGGETLDEFLNQFPAITREHAVEVLRMAHHAMIAATSSTRIAAE